MFDGAVATTDRRARSPDDWLDTFRTGSEAIRTHRPAFRDEMPRILIGSRP